MTKVINFSAPSPPVWHTPLDKLAQLSPGHIDSGLMNLKKRAKAKYFTNIYLPELINLDSPLKKSYEQTRFCCKTLHQVDDKIKSKFCNNRWCTVCNRIRIAKAINGYMPQMKAFKDPYFITLTKPTVKAYELKRSIAGMVQTWRLIYKCLKKRSMPLVGIRKLECTYRPQQDRYHPHFHMIVDGLELAQAIKAEWLLRYPKARPKPQDIRPADQGSMLELFKYFTKVITKEKLYIAPLDQIFQAMAGLRVFQPFGVKKVSEDVDQLQAEIIEGIIPKETIWEWLNHDWIDFQTDELLTGYEPSPELLKIKDNMIY